MERLASPDDLRFEIDEGTPSFAFDTGRSPFRTFRLPEGGPYTLTLSSYVVGDHGVAVTSARSGKLRLRVSAP